MDSRKFSSPSTPLRPRQFPSSGFEVIDPSQRLEEERLPFYKREDYYPMRIGEVLQDRYQVVAKLGYGTGSTLWLSRDLRDQTYWTLKVHINTLKKHHQKLKVYRHLSGTNMDDHPGQEYVRQFQDSFKLQGPNGEHDVFVMTPLGMSLRTLQELQKNKIFQQSLVTTALGQVLLGLNFLHEADVIHTDLHSDNLLIAITDDSVLSTVEENEMHKPSARKQVGDTIIYVSQYMLGGAGPLTICDLGQARIGRVHRGNAMPIPYRAPEVILGMTWGNAVDVWSVGLLAWDLLEKESLFRVYDHESEEQNDAHHLAAMTALLGPPPPEFLRRAEKTRRYWNEDGQWLDHVPLPSEKKLESLSSTLSGQDKEMFLNFLQCVLTWLPEDRLTTLEAYFHPWLRGKRDIAQSEDE
ncbi:kinase-like protein [Mariannaea sp. PMI_226]|nr:kinase-like protein [Mariannaea sp. PMI_226]